MSPYKHAEAFALMWYRCEECGHRERIWNSRDGVTPFCIRCPSCGQLHLQHVDWKQDESAPGHKLEKGQRYFRDGTADEAVAITERRIARWADSASPIPTDVAERLLSNARNFDGEWRSGWPMLDQEAA